MRGDDPRHDGMFSYITPEARVRPDIVDTAVAG